MAMIQHNTNGVNNIMFFHTLPVEVLDNLLLNLSPEDIVSFLEAMGLDIKFINRVSFYRPYCQIKLNSFCRNYSVMHNTFDLLVRRYSSKKNFYRKLFMIIIEAHRTPETGYYSSIEIENGWLDSSGRSNQIIDTIFKKMIKTFVYREDRHNISAVQWSHDWDAYMWPTTIFPLTFSLLVHYPIIFQNIGEEGAGMIYKCFTYGITFSMIQNRILDLTASGEEPTFDTVFSNELFND